MRAPLVLGLGALVLLLSGPAQADVLGTAWCGHEREGLHVHSSPGYLVCVAAEPACVGSLPCTPRVCMGIHDLFLLPC